MLCEDCAAAAAATDLPDLVQLRADAAVTSLDRVWWDDFDDRWVTDFPLPPGADREDYEGDGEFGDPEYARPLTPEEEEAIAHRPTGPFPTLDELRQREDRGAFFRAAAGYASLDDLLRAGEAIVRTG